MKNLYKLFGIIAFIAVMGFSMIACDGNGGENGDDMFTVANTAQWNAAIAAIKAGGNNKEYEIKVINNFNVPATELPDVNFGSVSGITVTITGNHTLTLTGKGALLVIENEQTVIIKDLNLKGHSQNEDALVYVFNGGVFTMQGSASVFGNTNTYNNMGAGVAIYGGTFIMRDSASIYNNTAKTHGGGVFVGLYIIWEDFDQSVPGTFVMQDNTRIYGNKADSGGGVYINPRCIFRLAGGIVYGNSATPISNCNTTLLLNGGAALYVSNEILTGSGSIQGDGIATYGGLDGEDASFSNTFPFSTDKTITHEGIQE